MAAPNTDPAPGAAYRRYVLGMLLVVYTFNFVDRQIVAILSPALKADLGLSDTELGFLKGFAFAVFYSVLGIPIARLADRGNRVTIISIALALWSLMTALCGLAANFAQLALARVGVGVGEAGCTPPAHSVLSDYFPKEQRATALAIYSSGIYLGQMFAFLAGGWLVTELGWRKAFFLVGLPGVAIALLVKLTIREPERGAQDGGDVAPSTDHFWRDALQLLSIPTYRGICLAVSLAAFAGYGYATWVVDFFDRAHGLEIFDITTPLAFIYGVGGGLGALLGGMITDRLGAADRSAYLRWPGYALGAMAPLFLVTLWAPNVVTVFIILFPVVAMTAFYLGPAFSLIQTLAPPPLRALSTAVFFLIINLVGLGLGPLAVGAFSDLFAAFLGEAARLQASLSILALVYLASAATFQATARGVDGDWARAQTGLGANAPSAFAAAPAAPAPPEEGGPRS